jgi:hypothetical protein
VKIWQDKTGNTRAAKHRNTGTDYKKQNENKWKD